MSEGESEGESERKRVGCLVGPATKGICSAGGAGAGKPGRAAEPPRSSSAVERVRGGGSGGASRGDSRGEATETQRERARRRDTREREREVSPFFGETCVRACERCVRASVRACVGQQVCSWTDATLRPRAPRAA